MTPYLLHNEAAHDQAFRRHSHWLSLQQESPSSPSKSFAGATKQFAGRWSIKRLLEDEELFCSPQACQCDAVSLLVYWISYKINRKLQLHFKFCHARMTWPWTWQSENKPQFLSVGCNGVYSLKWRLTDRYLRWGTLAGPRPGRADADQCKSSDFLQELCISGFPRFWVSPTCFPAK